MRTAAVETVAPGQQRLFVGRSNASIDDSPGERIDLIIEGDTLRFDASCNEVSAPYEVNDGVLHLDGAEARTTVVACSPEQDAAAFRLGELLESMPTFTVTGDALTIRSTIGEVELVDASAPHPDDLALIGTEWRVGLVVFDDTGGFMSLIEPAPVVRFGPDEVQLIFGCRTALLAATIDPDTRTIRMAPATRVSGLRRTVPPTTMPVPLPPPSTLPTTAPAATSVPATTAPPACDPATPSELERRIMPALVGELTYEIDIDQMHLRTADRAGLDMTAPLGPLPS